MKIRKSLGGAAAALSTVLLLAGCGIAGIGGSDDGVAEPPVQVGGAARNQIVGWDPCEVFGDHYDAMLEHLGYLKLRGNLLSKKVGAGVPYSHALCGTSVIWADDPKSEAGDPGGLVTISLIPENNPDEATTKYGEMLAEARDLFGEERAEKELTDGWDEGVLIFGAMIGDSYTALARDGSYLIEIHLETGADLIHGTGTQPGFTAKEAGDYLIDEALPNVRSTVREQLKAAGVSPDE